MTNCNKKPKELRMWRRLQNAIFRPNAWILSQGYLWVRKYLHAPFMYLRRSVLREQKTKQLSMLYDGYSILSDINYMLDSFRTAYRWRSLAYEIDSSTTEIIEDLVSIAIRPPSAYDFLKNMAKCQNGNSSIVFQILNLIFFNCMSGQKDFCSMLYSFHKWHTRHFVDDDIFAFIIPIFTDNRYFRRSGKTMLGAS